MFCIQGMLSPSFRNMSKNFWCGYCSQLYWLYCTKPRNEHRYRKYELSSCRNLHRIFPRFFLCRKTVAMDNTRSIVGCLQHFSEKSQVSLTAVELRFYPLHGAVLKLTEAAHRRCILTKIIVASHVHKLNEENSEYWSCQMHGEDDIRIRKLQAINWSIIKDVFLFLKQCWVE